MKFFNWKRKGNFKSTVYFVGVDADDWCMLSILGLIWWLYR